MSVAQLALLTRIKPYYIEKIESGALDTIPDPVFARGYVRVLAESLEVEHTEEFQRFIRDSASWNDPRSPDPPFIQTNVLPVVGKVAATLARSFLMVLVPLGLLVVALMQNQFAQSYREDPAGGLRFEEPESGGPVYISDADLAERLADTPRETLIPANTLRILARGKAEVTVTTIAAIEDKSQVLYADGMRPGEVFEVDLHYRKVVIQTDSPERLLVFYNGQECPYPTDEDGEYLEKLTVPDDGSSETAR